MNLFIILKSHFVKKTTLDWPLDFSMDFFKNARNMVTPVRKAISLDLSLDKYFNQIDSIPSELISLTDLTTAVVLCELQVPNAFNHIINACMNRFTRECRSLREYRL